MVGRFFDVEHQRELTDILEIHYIELSKFKRHQPLRTQFERWLEALKFGDIYESGAEPWPDDLKKEEEIIMALEAMRRAYADAEVRFMIEEREKAEHQWATDVQAAEAKGKADLAALCSRWDGLRLAASGLSGQPAYLYLLIEFQSTVDRYMALRLLTYILLFYADLLKMREERLPVVLRWRA